MATILIYKKSVFLISAVTDANFPYWNDIR